MCFSARGGQHHSSLAVCWGTGLGLGERGPGCAGKLKHVPAAWSVQWQRPEQGAEEEDGVWHLFSFFHALLLHLEMGGYRYFFDLIFYLNETARLKLVTTDVTHLCLVSISALKSWRQERKRSVAVSLPPPLLSALSPVPAGRRTGPEPPWSLHPWVQPSFWVSSLLQGQAWTCLSFWYP